MSGHAKCRWCEQRHEPRWLCDPARMLLDAVRLKGQEGNLPLVEFAGDPIPADQLGMGLEPGDELLRQLVVKAGVVKVTGVNRPLLALTGTSPYGHNLPHWFYVADSAGMTEMVRMLTDAAALAVRTASDMNDAGR